MKKLGITLAGLFTCLSSFACLNIYYDIDEQGHLHRVVEEDVRFYTGFNKKALYSRLQELKTLLDTNPGMEVLSDYAVTLLKLGRVKESLTILRSLQDAYPEEYQLAANLGTAYELAGELDSAYQYIELGTKLNPKAHGGSEWVHLAVLKTKMILKEDTTYLQDHTVLELDSLKESDTVVLKHIQIQLQERIPFMPGKDNIMASLVEDLGDCYARTASVELGKALYALAVNYYGARKEQLQPKINRMLKYRYDRQQKYGKGGGRPLSSNEINDSTRKKYGMEATPMTFGGISYRQLLMQTPNMDYKPDWDQSLLQTDSLLATINLEPIVNAKPEPRDQKKHHVNSLHDGEKDPVWTYAFVVIALGGIGYAIYRSWKRKS